MTTTAATATKVMTMKMTMTEYIGEIIEMIIEFIMFHSRLKFVVSFSVIKNITHKTVNKFRRHLMSTPNRKKLDVWQF